jgi:hypothetical protein
MAAKHPSRHRLVSIGGEEPLTASAMARIISEQ